MMLNDFVCKHNSKKTTTSKIKIQQVLSSLSLNDLGICLRDGPYLGDIGVANLHPSKGTHRVLYEIYFNSYGCAPPQKLSKFIIKRTGFCLYSEDHIQKKDSFCASHCLYILYLTKVVGIDFKSVV